MAAGDEQDLIEAVVTCEGNLHDPDFQEKFRALVDKLKSALYISKTKDPFRVRKIEPWNSVRVTISIPKEAAQKLKLLAQQGSTVLRSMGILSVQVEGDQVISLTWAAHTNNEVTQVILRQTSDESAGSSGTSGVSSSSLPASSPSIPSISSSVASVSSPLPLTPVSSTEAGGMAVTLDMLSNSSSSAFRSPNVVAPSGEAIPNLPPKTPTSGIRPTLGGPFPFVSMTHAAQAIQRSELTPVLNSNNVVNSNNTNNNSNAANSTNTIASPVSSSSSLTQGSCKPVQPSQSILPVTISSSPASNHSVAPVIVSTSACSVVKTVNVNSESQVTRLVIENPSTQAVGNNVASLGISGNSSNVVLSQAGPSQSLQLQLVNVPPPYPGVNTISSNHSINSSSSSSSALTNDIQSRHQQQPPTPMSNIGTNSSGFANSNVPTVTTVSSSNLQPLISRTASGCISEVPSASPVANVSDSTSGVTSLAQPVSSPLLVNLLQNNDISPVASSSSTSIDAYNQPQHQVLHKNADISTQSPGSGETVQVRYLVQHQQQLKKAKRGLSMDGASSVPKSLPPGALSGSDSVRPVVTPVTQSSTTESYQFTLPLPSDTGSPVTLNRVANPVSPHNKQGMPASNQAGCDQSAVTVLQGRTIVQGNIRVLDQGSGQVRTIPLQQQPFPSPISTVASLHGKTVLTGVTTATSQSHNQLSLSSDQGTALSNGPIHTSSSSLPQLSSTSLSEGVGDAKSQHLTTVTLVQPVEQQTLDREMSRTAPAADQSRTLLPITTVNIVSKSPNKASSNVNNNNSKDSDSKTFIPPPDPRLSSQVQKLSHSNSVSLKNSTATANMVAQSGYNSDAKSSTSQLYHAGRPTTVNKKSAKDRPATFPGQIASGKPRQFLINPLTGHLEPMPSESSSESEGDDGESEVGRKSNSHKTSPHRNKLGKGSLPPGMHHRQIVTTETGVTVARVIKTSTDLNASLAQSYGNFDGKKVSSHVKVNSALNSSADPLTSLASIVSVSKKPREDSTTAALHFSSQKDSKDNPSPATLTATSVSGEKIKLRLKLEKSEPISPAYKVDVSFVKKSEKGSVLSSSSSSSSSLSVMSTTATASNQPGSVLVDPPRVPPLHISLRGKNAAVVVSPRREEKDIPAGFSGNTKDPIVSNKDSITSSEYFGSSICSPHSKSTSHHMNSHDGKPISKTVGNLKRVKSRVKSFDGTTIAGQTSNSEKSKSKISRPKLSKEVININRSASGFAEAKDTVHVTMPVLLPAVMLPTPSDSRKNDRFTPPIGKSVSLSIEKDSSTPTTIQPKAIKPSLELESGNKPDVGIALAPDLKVEQTSQAHNVKTVVEVELAEMSPVPVTIPLNSATADKDLRTILHTTVSEPSSKSTELECLPQLDEADQRPQDKVFMGAFSSEMSSPVVSRIDDQQMMSSTQEQVPPLPTSSVDESVATPVINLPTVSCDINDSENQIVSGKEDSTGFNSALTSHLDAPALNPLECQKDSSGATPIEVAEEVVETSETDNTTVTSRAITPSVSEVEEPQLMETISDSSALSLNIQSSPGAENNLLDPSANLDEENFTMMVQQNNTGQKPFSFPIDKGDEEENAEKKIETSSDIQSIIEHDAILSDANPDLTPQQTEISNVLNVELPESLNLEPQKVNSDSCSIPNTIDSEIVHCERKEENQDQIDCNNIAENETQSLSRKNALEVFQQNDEQITAHVPENSNIESESEIIQSEKHEDVAQENNLTEDNLQSSTAQVDEILVPEISKSSNCKPDGIFSTKLADPEKAIVIVEEVESPQLKLEELIVQPKSPVLSLLPEVETPCPNSSESTKQSNDVDSSISEEQTLMPSASPEDANAKAAEETQPMTHSNTQLTSQLQLSTVEAESAQLPGSSSICDELQPFELHRTGSTKAEPESILTDSIDLGISNDIVSSPPIPSNTEIEVQSEKAKNIIMPEEKTQNLEISEVDTSETNLPEYQTTVTSLDCKEITTGNEDESIAGCASDSDNDLEQLRSNVTETIVDDSDANANSDVQLCAKKSEAEENESGLQKESLLKSSESATSDVNLDADDDDEECNSDIEEEKSLTSSKVDSVEQQKHISSDTSIADLNVNNNADTCVSKDIVSESTPQLVSVSCSVPTVKHDEKHPSLQLTEEVDNISAISSPSSPVSVTVMTQKNIEVPAVTSKPPISIVLPSESVLKSNNPEGKIGTCKNSYKRRAEIKPGALQNTLKRLHDNFLPKVLKTSDMQDVQAGADVDDNGEESIPIVDSSPVQNSVITSCNPKASGPIPETTQSQSVNIAIASVRPVASVMQRARIIPQNSSHHHHITSGLPPNILANVSAVITSAALTPVASLSVTSASSGGPTQTVFAIHPNMTIPANFAQLQQGGHKMVPIKLLTLPKQSGGHLQTIPIGSATANRSSPNLLDAVNIVANAGSRSSSPKTSLIGNAIQNSPLNLSSVSLPVGSNLHFVPISVSSATGTTGNVKVLMTQPIKMQQAGLSQSMVVKSVLMGNQSTTIRVIRPANLQDPISIQTLLKPKEQLINAVPKPKSELSLTESSAVKNDLIVQPDSLFKKLDGVEIVDTGSPFNNDELSFEADIIHDEKDLADVLAAEAKNEVISVENCTNFHIDLKSNQIKKTSKHNNETIRPVINMEVSEDIPNHVTPKKLLYVNREGALTPDSPAPVFRTTSPLFTYSARPPQDRVINSRCRSLTDTEGPDLLGEDQEIIDSFQRSPTQPRLSPQTKSGTLDSQGVKSTCDLLPDHTYGISPVVNLTNCESEGLGQELSIEIPPMDIEVAVLSPSQNPPEEKRCTRSTRSNTRLSPDITAFMSDTPKPSKLSTKVDSLAIKNSPKPSPTGSLKVLSPTPSSLTITPSTSTRSSPILHNQHQINASNAAATINAVALGIIDKIQGNTVGQNVKNSRVSKPGANKRKRQESDSSSASRDENLEEKTEIELNSRPGKRKCSENAAEMIKVCIGVEDSPKRNSITSKKTDETKLKDGKGKKAMATVQEEDDDLDSEISLSRGRSGRSSRESSEDRSSSRGSSAQRSVTNADKSKSVKDDEVSKDMKSSRLNNRGGKDVITKPKSERVSPQQSSTPAKKTKEPGKSITRRLNRPNSKDKSPLTPAKTRTNVRKDVLLAQTPTEKNATGTQSSQNPDSENARRKTRSSAAVDTSDSEISHIKRRRISKDANS